MESDVLAAPKDAICSFAQVCDARDDDQRVDAGPKNHFHQS